MPKYPIKAVLLQGAISVVPRSCNYTLRPISRSFARSDGAFLFAFLVTLGGEMLIRKADTSDLKAITELAALLWPDDDKNELEISIADTIGSDNETIFIYIAESKPVAFARCSLRHDYVEGTESSPVGYLEGIFVAEEYRRRGIARSLLSVCENWAKSKGCREFASDCEIGNTDSLSFHLKSGFEEANRLICFKKQL